MPTDLLILDITTGLIVGATSDLTMGLEPNHRLLLTPDHAAAWYWNGDDLIWDPLDALEHHRAARITQIKQEAARFTKLDWQVQRAQEREKAGWATGAETAAVFAEREAIRRSSNAAEERLNALTTLDQVETFLWQINVPVPTPRRLTQKPFADRVTDAELTGQRRE